MRFPYRSYEVQLFDDQPSIRIYRPVVPVLLHGPNGVARRLAIVDAGANQTVVPRATGESVGIAIDDTRSGRIGGVGGSSISVCPGDAELEFHRAHEQYRWSATILFSDDDYVLLGNDGCLEFFIATFEQAAHRLDLAPIAGFGLRDPT